MQLKKVTKNLENLKKRRRKKQRLKKKKY